MKYGIFLALLIISVIPAHADNGWNFINDFRKLSQNFVEAITIDPQQKQELILRNMAQWQNEKEQLVQNNMPVPVQYDQIINQKQESIKRMENDDHFLSNIIDSVLVGQELGKIQSYVTEFHKLKTENIPSTEKQSRVTNLEREVNQLNLVKKHCTPISVNVLLSVSDPYDTITTDYCSTLKDIPKPVIMSAIGE